jgi:hypothetical protein
VVRRWVTPTLPSCCRVTESQTGNMNGSTGRQCACLNCSVFGGKPCTAFATGTGWLCSRCAQRECEGFTAAAAAAAAAKPCVAIEEHDKAAEAEVRPLPTLS